MLSQNQPNRPTTKWIRASVYILQHIRKSERQQEYTAIVDGDTQLHLDPLESEGRHVGLVTGQGTFNRYVQVVWFQLAEGQEWVIFEGCIFDIVSG